MQELLETESNYVEVLNMLRKHFIRPVSSIKVSSFHQSINRPFSIKSIVSFFRLSF
jgi:hypothetical protein